MSLVTRFQFLQLHARNSMQSVKKRAHDVCGLERSRKPKAVTVRMQKRPALEAFPSEGQNGACEESLAPSQCFCFGNGAARAFCNRHRSTPTNTCTCIVQSAVCMNERIVPGRSERNQGMLRKLLLEKHARPWTQSMNQIPAKTHLSRP